MGVIEHGHHSEKPQTSVPERDMQPQCQAGQHSGGREGEEREKKRGKCLLPSIKKINTNKLNHFNMKNNRRGFFSMPLYLQIFWLLKIQPKYLLLTEINVVGQNTATWLW